MTKNPIKETVQPEVFRKVLVANRGEIARRIFRTLREMGISTVAVFSDADRDATHVSDADEAVRLGPAPSAESYLNQDAVISAAKAVGAQAIHPGYGFLAENPEFAERCEREELVFIGPSPSAIRRMGNKAEAKALAAKIGVPMLDGFSLQGMQADAVRRQIDAIGYPILIKAAAGGGGKGMRIVRRSSEGQGSEGGGSELDAALAAARRESQSAFGDDALLVERLLSSPQHVEIQILADAHGCIVHGFERDCSVQRRHQKVLEEAPSPVVDEALRERMGEAAVALARAVEYRSVGTVEFLLDEEGAFYFLEMNTRLQVEHPVTEAITGLDLVRLQIEVAQGSPLGIEQDALQISGHAIEARLYAEDPCKNFLPATGSLALWSVPELPGLRVDSGVEQGDEIGMHYDPMLAKVIAHGANRAEALRRLHRGLSQLAVGGLANNRDFLLSAIEHPAFVRAEVDTGFIDRHLPAAERVPIVDPEGLDQHAIVATVRNFHQRRQRPGPVPSGVPSGWRNNRWRAQDQSFEHGDGQIHVCYTVHEQSRETERTGPRESRFSVEVKRAPTGGAAGSKTHDVRLIDVEADQITVEIDGVRRRYLVACRDHRMWIHGQGRVSELMLIARFPERKASEVAGGCVAPMTGKVVAVPVASGQRVKAGDALVVLEAMKMEHQLSAHADGLVESVRVEVGQMVDPDEVMVVVVPIPTRDKELE